MLFLRAPLLLAQQALLQKQVELDKTAGTVQELLQELSRKGSFTFSYGNNIGLQRQVTLQHKSQTVEAHLQELFAGQQVAYLLRENKIILYVPAKSQTNNPVPQKVTVSGYVTDKATGETLIGATVQAPASRSGVVSNQYGFYSLTLPAGETTLQVSYIGYQSQTLSLHLQRDTTLALPLTAASTTMNAVTVTAPGQQQLAPAGLLSMPVERLQRVPTLLGEPDLIKALALTPGVTTGNEGTTGLLVRGGTQDQNLILLDEATVYNAAHLFGFVSIFNSDALKKVDMYKGGFPARFGGRLSSVLDITMKEGNNQELKGEASIGLISSRFNLEGPIGSDRTSFMFSGRASYLSLLLLPRYFDFKRKSTASYYNYHLYDLNGKVNHQFKDGSRLFLSIYNGTDFWNAQEKNSDELTKLQLGWGNTTATARYSRVLHPKLFYRSVLTHSQYRYHLTGENRFQESESNQITSTYATQSTVRDWTWRNGIDYFPGANHQVKLGSEITNHVFQPGAIRTNSALDTDTLQRANQQIGAWEYVLYAEDEALPLP
ncbi:TonB-dependent receptor [Pontibacter beigongshangensis]|uniref:TonB-dependent receptor n=1 Tax=Pontibacter beigongshangensis TaxID=2574733 RepID=UPI00164F1E58|nr:TonB-dependent receptor [Pontibacter beigongshangensis]